MKKERFKLLIKEFHEMPLPAAVERDIRIPDTHKIITIAGPRRAGKTFLFYRMIATLRTTLPVEQSVYVNFEDDRILPLEAGDLQELMEAYYELYPDMREREVWFFLDEIQNIGGWEMFVRRLHDREKVRLFVTGSSSRLFSGEIATALRGRTLTSSLWTLSFSEYLRFKNLDVGKDIAVSSGRFRVKKAFGRYLEYGGYPEVVIEQGHLEHAILENYFDVMLYRDIVERFSVRNIVLLKTLAKYLITNFSSLFSVTRYFKTIRDELPVSRETVAEYLGYLEEAGLVHPVPVFSYSLKVRQRNPRKVYCVDNGLRNAVAFTFSEDAGRLAENLVFIHLRRSGFAPCYWSGKNEVDFVITDRKGGITGINVCYTDDVPGRERAGLMELKEKFKKVTRLIVLTRDLKQMSEGIEYIPLWLWLLGVES